MRPVAVIPCWLALVLLLLGALPLRAETDDALAAAKGVTPPAAWLFPPQHPLRVQAVRGLWYDYFQVDAALARLGGAVVADSWHANSWETQAHGLRYFPETYAGLMRRHLVMLCNVNAAAIGPITRKMLKDYVERGGALLILGGNYAYDADYHGSALDDIAPVTFPEKPTLLNTPDGLPLALGKDAPAALRGRAWAAAPRVYWYHQLQPKPGAKVLLTAGDKPLLITGAFGKGRVAVFAGSVMGDPGAGQLPFWQWSDWPAVLADTIAWLTEPTRAPAALEPAAAQELSKRLLGSGVKKYADVADALAGALSCCQDAAGAKLLLDAVSALDDDPPLEIIEQVGAEIRPCITADMAPVAHALIESGLPHKASLGLRVLGQCKTPDARQTLMDVLRTGEPPSAEDGGADTEKMTVEPAYLAFVARLGALEGLGNLGDAAALPALKKFRQGLTKNLSDPAKFPVVPTQEDELYLAATLAQLRCGDAAAADPAIDALLEHYYLMVRNMVVVDAPQYSRKAYAFQQLIAKLWKTYPRLRADDAILYLQLASAPPATLTALAKRLAVETTPHAVQFAFAAFGPAFRGPGFTMPPEALDALAGAKLPALVELAHSLRGR